MSDIYSFVAASSTSWIDRASIGKGSTSLRTIHSSLTTHGVAYGLMGADNPTKAKLGTMEAW
jgi:hypothetical protein